MKLKKSLLRSIENICTEDMVGAFPCYDCSPLSYTMTEGGGFTRHVGAERLVVPTYEVEGDSGELIIEFLRAAIADAAKHQSQKFSADLKDSRYLRIGQDFYTVPNHQFGIVVGGKMNKYTKISYGVLLSGEGIAKLSFTDL